MIGVLLQGVLETQANFILAAAGVCVLTAFTLVLLMRNTDIASKRQKTYAAIWTALVAGVGVWTTHFVAMIGYRPDAALTYDLSLTTLSIFVGVLGIGIPVAASIFATQAGTRIILGVVAGLGVAAMHLTGMSAIQNCLATYNPLVLIAGVAAGIAGFVVALQHHDDSRRSQLIKSAGIVLGVCGLHFIAMAAVSLDQTGTSLAGIGGSFLSIMVAVVSLGVFTMSVLATFTHRRTLAMTRAGY
ncbi:MHYT domain-containing protein [Pseudooceanicola sp. MF1-13]|uniref:MHYT domain-containing protein n=1 Tax=Pseudooceanicola sp. MF1-13 TaxID=3379095 RepID=UPI003892CB5E